MKRKIFGTDGVRGRANVPPITAEIALRLGLSAGHYFRSALGTKRVVIGKDTRRSGYMLENAMTAGFTSVGMNVFLLGPLPTPAIGMLTKSMRADLGVVISASHNQFDDNGIKFFGPDGFKLSDQVEGEIQELLENGVQLAASDKIGRAQRIDDGLFRYVERTKSTFPAGMRLDGIKVVIDCANGAAYRAAPEVLWELGAEVIPMGVSPNGSNINADCGSTYPQIAAETVIAHNADVGLCLDGDADRLIIIDENGKVADGDQLMALLAYRWSHEGRLNGRVLVTTVMSNLGLERYLKDQGISLERTKVGDRYVVERMREGGFNLGGEQSGHIIMSDYSTTGDGLMAGLHFLAEIIRTDQPASQLLGVFEPVPQLLKNVLYSVDQDPLEMPSVKQAILHAEDILIGQGRLLIRKSGTEPLIRVMAECENDTLLQQIVDDVVQSVIKAKAC